MPAYQLQIKQVVDYPRCRIYRQFIHRLIDDRSIRASGSVRSKSFLNGFGLVFSVRRFPSWESFSSVISLTSPLWGEGM